MILPAFFRKTALVAALAALAACGHPHAVQKAPPPQTDPHYAARLDGGTEIPAVDPRYLTGTNARVEVAYDGPEKPGTIIVDPFARVLYLVQDGDRAIRYGIAVGREGKGFRGDATIARKEQWPFWQPTANMLKTEPDVYGDYRAGLPGGIENPLGARALYLYRDGKDTHYRIHGTNNISTIGRATSAGCIRLYNQDAIDLFDQVKLGTHVHVRSQSESVRAEGELVEDAYGFMVPMDSLPQDVQDQIRAGLTPWPKFVPIIGVNSQAPDIPKPMGATN